MKTKFALLLILGMIFMYPKQGFSLEPSTGPVKVQGRQLLVDFDGDHIYEPFFVKGVGYTPIPIGHFQGVGQGWSANCWYTGPFPLNYPELRFERNSPDAIGNFNCGLNGSDFYQDAGVLERDLTLIKNMNANTIRTWGKVSTQLMQKSDDKDVTVMAGYWIDHGLDYTFPGPGGPAKRQDIINDFVSYVNAFKNSPALLMWGLSNENNLNFCGYTCPQNPSCDRNAQVLGFFQLVNDMALAAKAAEGTTFHPIIVVFAELTPDVINYTQYMPAVDIIGINSYRGENFDGWPNPDPDLFDEFEIAFPSKSMIVTEFGADAWNSCGNLPPEQCIINGVPQVGPDDGREDQMSQANYLTSQWNDIASHSVANGGPTNGGVVFQYSDIWRDYGQRQMGDPPNDPCVWISSDWTPSVRTHDTHFLDPNFFGFGVSSDNLVNMEWFGIMSIAKNPDPHSPDIMTPRDAYYHLQSQFECETACKNRNNSFEVDSGIDFYPDWSGDDNIANNNKPDGFRTTGFGLLDSQEVYQGNKSLKINVINNRGYSYQDIPIEHNKRYKVSGYVKTDCVDEKCYGTILTECEGIDRRGICSGEHCPIWDFRVCGLNTHPSDIVKLYGDNDWTKIEFEVKADNPNAHFLRLLCYNTAGRSPGTPLPPGTGTIWCDAMKVEEIDSNPGGGGGPCLLSGAPILMSDKTLKPIEQIKKGDSILAYDVETNKTIPDKVKQVFVHDTDNYLIINNKLKITPNHLVYANGKWMEIGKLKIGDKILTHKGKYQNIKSIKQIKAPVKVYNFEVNPKHTYIANGYVVHNLKAVTRELTSE
ncbi:MAG: polymorphic toxin-type HINT domain-containing protein [Candidatus Omnitrophota bacterium]|nr:polymorphic toxin-type HINT domain-containing protein [Candidatus Omnitrophota bacterium]